jgi:hypothetical protein
VKGLAKCLKLNRFVSTTIGCHLFQSAELAVSNKFKHLVGDLRKSWEEEETSRAKQLEERLRNHYSAVLEHMESQLQMALKLQDEADRQWMEDVEARNKQQVR